MFKKCRPYWLTGNSCVSYPCSVAHDTDRFQGESIDTEHNSFERWIYADVYIYGHSLIVFWERKIGELGHGGPSQLAVESSRKVLGTILKVSEADAKSGNDLMIYTGSVA